MVQINKIITQHHSHLLPQLHRPQEQDHLDMIRSLPHFR